jgi:hypothetical protein
MGRNRGNPRPAICNLSTRSPRGPMLILSTVFTVLLLVGTSIFVNAAFPLKSKISNWLALATLGYAQIVLASTVLSELRALTLPGFLFLQVLMFLVAFVIW